MPGLYLGGQAGARAVAGNGNGAPAPSTASQAAFGSGYSSGGSPSTFNALSPNDPFGIALWSAVIAAGLLILIRHSLPG